jgi:hypothetical protein
MIQIMYMFFRSIDRIEKPSLADGRNPCQVLLRLHFPTADYFSLHFTSTDPKHQFVDRWFTAMAPLDICSISSFVSDKHEMVGTIQMAQLTIQQRLQQLPWKSSSFCPGPLRYSQWEDAREFFFSDCLTCSVLTLPAARI